MIFVKRSFPITLLLALLAVLCSPVVQAESRTSARESFLTYRCDYEASTNTAKIFAALTDTSGLPMPRDRYNVTVTTASTVEVLPPQRIGVSMLARREPLRMVIVMDTTDTMPIQELVTAISTRLVPKLDVSDQVAFMSVDSVISPLTTFYIDKNRLINEHMLSLEHGVGDNQVYNGIAQAIQNMGANNGVRQVVVIMTDSSPRKPETQATAAEIGTRARNAKIQLYPFGIFLYDEPNAEDLISMAESSQGFAWIYDEANSNNASTGVAIGDRLEKLVDALNSEIQIAIDMRGQVPDANGQVIFDVAVDLQNGLKLSDQIACPYKVTTHKIAFAAGTPAEQTTSKPVELQVVVESDFTQDETAIVFRVNDESNQNGDSPTFSFDASTKPPDTYKITAELRDSSDNVLATTDSITITVVPSITLTLLSGALDNLSQPVTLQVETSSPAALQPVHFSLGRASTPQLNYPLGAGIVPFQNGRAILTVTDLRAEAERLISGIQPNEALQIMATVEGDKGETVAVSDPLLFNYTASGANLADLQVTQTAVAIVLTGAAATPVPGVTPATPDAATVMVTATPVVPPAGTILGVTIPRFLVETDPLLLASEVIALILLIINWLLFFQVGRQRIRRMILNPDSTEMSPRLMALTVRRDSLKQTMVLTKRTVTLGRGNLNDVNLGDSTSISREHGVVMWRRGKWFYSNRKPRLKCRVDGKRYSGYILKELEPVTEIEIGDARLFFHSSTQQDVSEFSKTTL